MKALVLVAGEGTRMRPLTANMPKPLLPLAGKPMLTHILENLQAIGITHVHLLLGWLDGSIRRHYGDGSSLGMKIEYLYQEKRLGTAHAVSIGRKALENEPFMCVNGDVLVSSKGLQQVVDAFEEGKGMVMGLAEVSDPSRYGVVQTEGDGKVAGIFEKPEKTMSGLINAGIYALSPDIFEDIEKTPISTRDEYEITDTLSRVMGRDQLFSVNLGADWIEIGAPWDLLSANEKMMTKHKGLITGIVEEGAVLKGEVSVGEGSIIRAGSYILGPVCIGKNTDIGPNCYIRAHTLIGDNCKVGNACEVKNVILMDGSNIPHQNYVGDSIIGRKCNLGAGTKVANLRLDNRNVRAIQYSGMVVDTGRRKLGAIIGDNVKTGINVTIDSGTVVSEDCFIGPGAVVSGRLAPNSRHF